MVQFASGFAKSDDKSPYLFGFTNFLSTGCSLVFENHIYHCENFLGVNPLSLYRIHGRIVSKKVKTFAIIQQSSLYKLNGRNLVYRYKMFYFIYQSLLSTFLSSYKLKKIASFQTLLWNIPQLELYLWLVVASIFHLLVIQNWVLIIGYFIKSFNSLTLVLLFHLFLGDILILYCS